MRRLVLALMLLMLTGCAGGLPARPAVEFYTNPAPMLIPQAPVARGAQRAIRPEPVPASICLTDADALALENYLDQVDALRKRH